MRAKCFSQSEVTQQEDEKKEELQKQPHKKATELKCESAKNTRFAQYETRMKAHHLQVYALQVVFMFHSGSRFSHSMQAAQDNLFFFTSCSFSLLLCVYIRALFSFVRLEQIEIAFS